MPRDRSLDEFLGGGRDADGDEDDSDPATETDPGDVADEEPEPVRAAEPIIEPKETTFGWSPDGGECAACGETVDARWRDDGELVCANCKDW